MIAWRTAARAALALLVAPASAVASAQAKCDINVSSPFQVSSARMYLGKAGSGKPDEQRKHARNAVQVLTDHPERINNQVGRNFVLGQTLVWWATQGRVAATVRRGEIGYATSADATIDLGAAIDTAFSAVESAKPECRVETEKWRQQLWVPAINAAAKFINDDQLDSAEFYLRRANIVWSGSPLPTYYSAILAQRRNDPNAAAASFTRAAEQITPDVLARDTTLRKIREQSMYNAALLRVEVADRLQGDEKSAKQKEAAAALQAYISAYPNSPNVGTARTALARVLGRAGDTAAAVGIFSDMVADPAKYNDMQLFEAGTAAFTAKRYDDAIKLFEAGLQKNSSYRDALYNLANTYMAAGRYDRMLDVTKRLVAVDPNNPDNWRLMAAAYQRQSNSVPAARKRALTDSVLKYVAKSDSMPVRITKLRLQQSGDQHTLTGMIENRSGSPRNYVLTFDFLDRSGNVVTSQETAVSLPAKSTRDIRIEVNRAGIVAFRYHPVG